MVAECPVSDLKAPKVSMKPTMPLTHEEMGRILGAVDVYCQETPANGLENARHLRAFVLLLRYSGMRISDVVNLSAERFVGKRLFLYTQKTGVPVHVVIPEFVLRLLESTPLKSEKHFFLEWSRKAREYREELADPPTQALPISERRTRPRTPFS